MSAYILVVESDARLQKQITDALKEARYELASEAEISWAKRSLAARRPDAVVLDTALGDGSGFGLANSLRSDPDTAGIPLFFVASKARGAAHRTEAIRRYAPADYLNTPLDVDSLLVAVLQRVPPEPAPRPRPATAAPPPPPPPPIPASKIADPEQRREGRAVEKSAKDLVGAAAAFRGNLKKTPFARLLHKLYADRANGALLLLKDDVKKIVSFVDGYPVSVRSNMLSECLGQILLGKKLISAEILAESVRRMKSEKRRQGEILVEMGVLSPFNLSRALVEQMESKLFDVFGWQDGQFMFQENTPPPGGEAVRLEHSTAALILEGIRRHYDQARQAAVLEPFLGRYVKLASNPVSRFQEMTSDPAEVAFISGINGAVRMESLLDRAAISRPKAVLLVVALSEAGIIEPVDGPVRKSGTGKQVPAAPTPTPVGGPAPEPLSPTQLTLMLETLATQNFFVALGIRPDSGQADIDRAYEMLARQYHVDRYRGRPDEHRKLAQRIFEKLTDAHATLSDAAKRRAYIARLERSRPMEPTSKAVPNAAAEELYKTGMQHLASRRHRDAVEALRQAARLAPSAATYRAALGWALFREQPADSRAERAAVAELKRAIQLDGRYRQARLYLAQLYQQTGHTDLAIQELEKVLELDPNAFEAAEELRRLREAR